MHPPVPIVLELRYLRVRRSGFSGWKPVTKFIVALLAVFFLFQLLVFAWFSDRVFHQIVPDTPVPYLVHRGLFGFAFSLFFLRLLMNRGFDDTALILHRMNMRQRSVTGWHLILNTVNGYWLLLLLLCGIVVFRNCRSYEGCVLVYAQQVLTCATLEILLLIYAQYCNAHRTLYYLLFVTIYVVSNLFLSPVGSSAGRALWLILSFPVFLLAARYAKISTYRVLLADSAGGSGGRAVWGSSWKFSSVFLGIMFRFFFRRKALRNGTVFMMVVLASLLYLVSTLKPNPGMLPLLIWLTSLSFCLLNAPVLFSPDYLWAGFLLSGFGNRREYVVSKLHFLLVGCSFVLVLNVLFSVLTPSPIVRILPLYSIFFMGTLPYLFCWIRIRAFKPFHPYDRNAFSLNPHAKEDLGVLLPLLLAGYLYPTLVAAAVDAGTVFDLPLSHYLPLACIGGTGLLLHPVWTDKLTSLFESRRLRIYELSESL